MSIPAKNRPKELSSHELTNRNYLSQFVPFCLKVGQKVGQTKHCEYYLYLLPMILSHLSHVFLFSTSTILSNIGSNAHKERPPTRPFDILCRMFYRWSRKIYTDRERMPVFHFAYLPLVRICVKTDLIKYRRQKGAARVLIDSTAH